MKSDLSPVGRVTHWLEAPSPPQTLVLATTCGCDLARLERIVCEAVNGLPEFTDCSFSCLDFNEVRHLAGQPGIRHFVADRAGLDHDCLAHWNDHDLVLRGLASFGGLVLAGSTAIEATQGLPNTCRLMLSRCDQCHEEGFTGLVDPGHRHRPSEFVEDIVRLFTGWLGDETRREWRPRKQLRDVGTAAALCGA